MYMWFMTSQSDLIFKSKDKFPKNVTAFVNCLQSQQQPCNQVICLFEYHNFVNLFSHQIMVLTLLHTNRKNIYLKLKMSNHLEGPTDHYCHRINKIPRNANANI